jgi:hypothetical protein
VSAICIANRSSALSDGDVERCASAIRRQIAWQVSRFWPCNVEVISRGHDEELPPNAWPLFVYDMFTPATEITNKLGACGAHDFAKTPYGAVSLKQCADDNYEWTQVASHEAVEMAINPTLNIFRAAAGRMWLQDICNMCITGYCEDDDGVTLSNFATPSWYLPQIAGSRLDYTGRLIAPLQVENGGYAPSYAMGAGSTGT